MRHPRQENPDGDGISLPVLVIQAPPTPDEGRFFNTILEEIGAPYKPKDRIDTKQSQIIRILKLTNTRILIIDEIHHIMAGPTNKHHSFLNSIKYLGNELKIPIVGVGTRDAFNAVHTDDQLSSRFEPLILPRWQANREYRRLIMSFERIIPLKNPSHLAESGLATKLHDMSEGLIGELSTLISKAAVKAIENGTECITKKLLDSINWLPPADRKWKSKELV